MMPAKQVAENLFQKKYYRLALKYFLKIPEIDRTENTLLRIAYCYNSIKKYDYAEQYCQRTIDISPMNLEAHSILVKTYLNRSLWDKAFQKIQFILTENPNFPTVYTELAHYYYANSNYGDSMNALETAMELNPNDYYSHYLRGRLYDTENNLQMALQEFWKAFILKPSFGTFLPLLIEFLTLYQLPLVILTGGLVWGIIHLQAYYLLFLISIGFFSIGVLRLYVRDYSRSIFDFVVAIILILLSFVNL